METGWLSHAIKTAWAGGTDGRDFDVMLEAKGKDLALQRLREQLAARGVELDPVDAEMFSAANA